MKKKLSDNPRKTSSVMDMDLAANSHLCEQVLNASGMAMAIRDTELTPIFANQAFRDIYGFDGIDAHDVGPSDSIPLEETRKLFADVVRPAMNSGQSWEGAYDIRTTSGEKRTVWGRFDPVVDDNGSLTHVISFMQDASESSMLRKALAQSERHLHFLADNTSDGLFRIRLSDDHCDYVSSAIEHITGYSQEEFYDKSSLFKHIIPDDWKETVGTWWQEFQQGVSHYEYELPLTHKKGTRIWVQLRVHLVHDGHDEPIAIEGIITDVTDRHKAEEALAAAQESLNFISNSTSDIFFRLKMPEGTYDYLSPSVERFSGYTVEEYKSDPDLIRKTIHPDWQDWFHETWEEFLRGELRPNYEFQYIHKSGEIRWASKRVVLVRDNNGTPIAIEGIATDITDRKKAEMAAKESEERFHFLTENITDVIWTMDESFRFTYTTPSVEHVWGYSQDEILNKTIFDLTTPESLKLFKGAGESRARAEAKGNFAHLNRLEMEHIRGDGAHFWVETVVGRILDDEGRPCGYQGVSRDVTQRKQAEAKIAKSEARFRTLFEDSPISLWEEDLSKLKIYFDELKEQGITDFRQHFYDNPDDLGHCASLVEVVDVNKATLDLLGADSKEELFGNLEKVLTESSMAAFTEEMILLASGGCEYCGEITNRTLQGETIWVMVHFFVPPEYKDTLSRVIVSLLDVTPRKRAEQALMDSEERYRVLAENSQEGVIVTQDGEIRYLNERMMEIFGYPMAKLKEIHPLDVAHPDDREQALKQLEGLLSGKENEAFATFRVITAHNDVKWLNLSIKPIMWGGRQAQMEILTDITRHKKLENELLAAHAQMEDRIKKRTAELSEANIRLTVEAEERTKAQERILTLTQQLLRIQEDERQRISRDLHDNVAQDLSSIMLKMETLFDDQNAVDNELRTRGTAVTDILRKAIASVRDIAYGLRPPALDQLGLVSALENLCQEVGTKHGFEVDFFATGIEDIPMDFDAEINIYRMVQEAVRNISKHADATKGIVRIVKSHPDILIRVEDNGQGFDMEQRMTESAAEKRMGVRSMEERARLIGGTMDIQSLPGTGTRVIFKVPIENARRQQ